MMRKLLFICLCFFSFCLNAKTVRDDVSEVLFGVSTTETKITFPEKVVIGVRKSFQKDFSTELIDNIVYIKAKRTLDESKSYRFIAKTKTGDKSYILVVRFSSKPDDEVTIVKTAQKQNTRSKSLKNELAPHELVRHASQLLYSPDYAVEKPGLLRPITVDRDLNVDHIYRGSSLQIRPVAGFKYKDLYVFAFEVINKRTSVQKLETSNLFGRIDAIGATFQHVFVGQGSDKYTTLYIVSPHSNVLDIVGV